MTDKVTGKRNTTMKRCEIPTVLENAHEKLETAAIDLLNALSFEEYAGPPDDERKALAKVLTRIGEIRRRWSDEVTRQ